MTRLSGGVTTQGSRDSLNVLVIGGGAAGVSAAYELAERGIPVTLVDGNPSLGGKVRGWRDGESASCEHGLHGWWVEYANFRDLLERAGLIENLTDLVGPFTVIHRDGTVDRFTFSDLPSPLHVLGMLRGLRSVDLRGKVSSIRAGLAIAGFDLDSQAAELDGVDMRSWLRHAGVSKSAVAAVFEPTLRSNLFLPLEEISAAAGLNAIQRGSRCSGSWRFSWLRGNSGDYLWAPLERDLRQRGVDIRLSTRATRLRLDGDRVAGVTLVGTDGIERDVSAADVLMAVDIESCKQLVDASLSHIPYFRRVLNLSATDVLVTRTWFAGNAELRHRDGMLVGFRVVDAFIDVGRFQPELATPGMTVIETQSYLGRTWMDAPEASICELVRRDLTEALPELESTYVAKTVVGRHRGQFTAFGVGFETFRPEVRTPLANLFLAGDWIRAPEPVMFMENAIVTSRHAASAITVSRGGAPVPILAAPPADMPVRLIARTARALRRTRRAWWRVTGIEPIRTLVSR